MTEEKTEKEVTETLKACVRAVADEKSLSDALGISEEYLLRVETRAHELYASERYEQVETLMRGVVAIDPERFYARLLLGDSLTRQKEFKEGFEHLQKAHELMPDSEHVKFTLAQAYARGGVINKAKELLGSFDENSDFFQKTSVILERIGQVEAAQA